MSEWRDMPGHEGRYQVSDDGQVRNSRTGRLLKPWNNKGYVHVNLGRGNRAAVHTLVARAFVDGFVSRVEVNHKNGKRDDNRAANLEWVTRSANIKHAHAELPRKLHAWARRVAVVLPTGERIFNSTGEAARAVGSCAANVSKAIRCGYKVKGFEVRYV